MLIICQIFNSNTFIYYIEVKWINNCWHLLYKTRVSSCGYFSVFPWISVNQTALIYWNSAFTCRLRGTGLLIFLPFCGWSPRACANSSSNSRCRLANAGSEQPGKNQSSSISFVPQEVMRGLITFAPKNEGKKATEEWKEVVDGIKDHATGWGRGRSKWRTRHG